MNAFILIGIYKKKQFVGKFSNVVFTKTYIYF